MLPNSKKHAGQSVTLDVLSSLPENVVSNILVFLPLRDAVRTSILSTKWRYKWCSIPELKLDEKLCGTTRDLIPLTTKFTSIIYHLFAFHAGPISKFILDIRNLRDCPEIDKLIFFLSRNDIQHLDLRFSPYTPFKLVPSSIFTCLQLRHLSLKYCSIQLIPAAFKGFDRLISLKLDRVRISSKFLESLISNCPLLEQLSLHDNYCNDVIEINAPMLRSFDFVGSDRSMCLGSLPRLAKLSLWHVNYHPGSRNFLKSFYYLEHLELKGHSLKFLVAAAGEVPIVLPFDLNCLKRLRLGDISLEELDVVLCVLRMIRSFQYLQYLDIQVFDKDDDIPSLKCLELDAFSDMAFSHLRVVKLGSTIGSNPEMQLIKLLLAKSPMLETMLIEPTLGCDYAGETIKIPVLLNSFQRASPNVVVIYDLDD